jgi:hypothetical protein
MLFMVIRWPGDERILSDTGRCVNDDGVEAMLSGLDNKLDRFRSQQADRSANGYGASARGASLLSLKSPAANASADSVGRFW